MSHLYFTQSITDGKAVLCEEDAVHLVKGTKCACATALAWSIKGGFLPFR